MASSKARYKKPAPKVLATPESVRVLRCYACQGKAYIHQPIWGETVLLVVMNAGQETRHVQGSSMLGTAWACDVGALGEWRVLGWIPPEGQLRHGDLEDVDPELADWDRLPIPNTSVSLGAPSRPNLSLRDVDIVPWDEEGRPEF